MDANVLLPSEFELRLLLQLVGEVAERYVLLAFDEDPQDRTALARVSARAILEDNRVEEHCVPARDHNNFYGGDLADHVKKRIRHAWHVLLWSRKHREVDLVMKAPARDRLLLEDAAASLRAVSDILGHARFLAWDDRERLLAEPYP